MKTILFFTLFLMSALLYSQDEKQRFENTQTKQLTSNAAYNTAIDQMQSSADKNTQEKIKQLDDQFELNFSEKAKLENKIKLLQQKKNQAEDKLTNAKSDAEKEKFSEKIADLILDITKINKKLADNEIELKNLQELFKTLNK
ncbi:hypothetical protein [Kaistella yonginensis]|uniref:hypothetical protein n=1 Tax=Kaistella yonginensis TaxID=658267 RepID=UPI0025B325A5|nr:hypothetical protein [Kaistella yonginensis]MDN3605634.1 hypothetical protein [Kaistella yonginensis]